MFKGYATKKGRPVIMPQSLSIWVVPMLPQLPSDSTNLQQLSISIS